MYPPVNVHVKNHYAKKNIVNASTQVSNAQKIVNAVTATMENPTLT